MSVLISNVGLTSYRRRSLSSVLESRPNRLINQGDRPYRGAIALNTINNDLGGADAFLLPVESMLDGAEALAHNERIRFRHNVTLAQCCG